MAKSALSEPDLAQLRARLRVLEGLATAARPGDAEATVGVAAIDEALPWRGLPRAGLHEVVGLDRGAGGGFVVLLASRLAGSLRTLWCTARSDLYAPGLAALGLDPARILVARASDATGVLWAMEEGLRSGALGAVVGELHAIAPQAARRLQLAAREGRTPALLLRPAGARDAASLAVTRWHVAARRSVPTEPGLGKPRWHVTLARCRGGLPRGWVVEWDDATLRGAVVADLADRSAAPHRGAAAA